MKMYNNTKNPHPSTTNPFKVNLEEKKGQTDKHNKDGKDENKKPRNVFKDGHESKSKALRDMRKPEKIFVQNLGELYGKKNVSKPIQFINPLSLDSQRKTYIGKTQEEVDKHKMSLVKNEEDKLKIDKFGKMVIVGVYADQIHQKLIEQEKNISSLYSTYLDNGTKKYDETHRRAVINYFINFHY